MGREEEARRLPLRVDVAQDVAPYRRSWCCCCPSRHDTAAGRRGCARARGLRRCWAVSATLVFFLAAGAGLCLWRPWGRRSGWGTINQRAAEFAKLAGASYCPLNDLTTWTCGSKCIPGVSDVHICQGDTTKAFVALWEDRCILSIMGTQEYIAMFRDLEFYKTGVSWNGCSDCYVHDGFFNEWQSLSPCIIGSLLDAGCKAGSGIRVTGHSLGAGLGSLAMMDLAQKGWRIEEAYTFGMPRPGNEHFAAEFNRRFGDIFHRVTHHMDPIVHVPPSELITNWHFQHLEPELFFDGKVAQGSIVCSTDNDAQCSGQYSDGLHDLLHLGDHLSYMDIQIGTAGCGRPRADSLARPERNASLGVDRRHRRNA